MRDELKELVNRFLAWRLPADFSPDCHIHFDRAAAEKWGPGLWPSGTNLLNGEQARAMLEYVTEPLQRKNIDASRSTHSVLTPNHAEAARLALHKVGDSNLARCYVELREQLTELQAATAEVLRISDRKHDAWGRAQAVLSRLEQLTR